VSAIERWVLAWVNEQRTVKLGLPPLDALVPGSYMNAGNCPIARSLRHDNYNLRYSTTTCARYSLVNDYEGSKRIKIEQVSGCLPREP
jgi:hypothetical protein